MRSRSTNKERRTWRRNRYRLRPSSEQPLFLLWRRGFLPWVIGSHGIFAQEIPGTGRISAPTGTWTRAGLADGLAASSSCHALLPAEPHATHWQEEADSEYILSILLACSTSLHGEPFLQSSHAGWRAQPASFLRTSLGGTWYGK